jgi:hypothetical protein
MCFKFLTGQGVTAWSSATSYVQGDIASTADKSLWRALVANTNAAPASNAASWAPVGQHGERNVIMRDLYFLGPPCFYGQLGVDWGEAYDCNYGAYPLVDSDFPIAYAPYQAIPFQVAGTNVITFQPFSIEKDKLDYKTGFEASTLNLTVRPRDPVPATIPSGTPSPYTNRGLKQSPYLTFGISPSFSESAQMPAPYSDSYTHYYDSGLLIYQTMRQSFAQNQDWYLAPLTVFRTFSPADNPSDVISYGCAVMFRGRVSEITVDKEDVKLSISSLMEIFKQKVPSQTIQPGNRWAPYDFNSTPNYFLEGSGSAGYNWLGSVRSAFSIVDAQLAEGWALITNQWGEWWRHIYTNCGTYDSGGEYYTTLVFYEPLPVLSPTAEWQVQCWVSSDTSTNPSGPGAGFPYVPQPLTGVA